MSQRHLLLPPWDSNSDSSTASHFDGATLKVVSFDWSTIKQKSSHYKHDENTPSADYSHPIESCTTHRVSRLCPPPWAWWGRRPGHPEELRRSELHRSSARRRSARHPRRLTGCRPRTLLLSEPRRCPLLAQAGPKASRFHDVSSHSVGVTAGVRVPALTSAGAGVSLSPGRLTRPRKMFCSLMRKASG